MKLWMIASANLWQELKQEGQLFSDPAKSHLKLFERAYEWMRCQMAKRLPGFQGHSPWWAWAQWKVEHPRPDLRARRLHGGFAPGSLCVRMELELPEHEVLCSDFALWHVILNDGHISLNETEADAWDRLLPELQTREVLEASWERIFDLERRGADPKWMGSTAKEVQAVFETLRLIDVRQVTYFRARPTS